MDDPGRINDIEARVVEGQGLGLALVRKLVRDLGGRVSHERDERAGLTHFRINLPVAAGQEPL